MEKSYDEMYYSRKVESIGTQYFLLIYSNSFHVTNFLALTAKIRGKYTYQIHTNKLSGE